MNFFRGPYGYEDQFFVDPNEKAQVYSPEQTAEPQQQVQGPPMPQPPPQTPRDIFADVTPETFMLSAKQEQERQDRMAQMAVFQTLSQQFANHANQWKPGSVDTGANAKLFQTYQGLVDEPVHALERKKSAYQNAEAIEQRRLANDSVRAKMDPNSDVSRGLRMQVAQQAKQRADMIRANPQMSPLAAQLDQIADAYAKGLQPATDSEKQLATMRQMFGDFVGVDRNTAIREQGTAKLAQDQGQFEAKLAETKEARHNSEALKRAELELEKMKISAAQQKDQTLNITKPQEKLNEQIENLNVAKKAMQEILSLKKSVNTGFASDKVAKLGAMFDLTSEDRNRLNALLARVFNKETKELAGAAVSAQEWARISPQIPQTNDDDNVFLSKLTEALKQTDEMIKARTNQYQRLGSGKAQDASKTAQTAVAKEQGGGANDEKAAKARRALKLGTPAQQAGARAWLEANGYAVE